MSNNRCCCVVNCKNNGKNSRCKFYTFSTLSWKLNQRNIWIDAIKRKKSREMSESLTRVRLISWLVMGALCNSRGGQQPLQQPLPLDATCHITDHIQTIMSSYVEQSKLSSQRMNPLFHAFVICHLWTLYLEELANGYTPNSDQHYTVICVLLDFWSKLVPSILQVTVQSKLLAETVNLHFLNMLESLLECYSTILNKLLPLWMPVLFSPLFKMPRHVLYRLHSCRETKPEGVSGRLHSPDPTVAGLVGHTAPGVYDPIGSCAFSVRHYRRLHRLLSKMAQLELQPQSFYLI